MNKQERKMFYEDPRDGQRDACGVGFIASLREGASHRVIQDGLTILSRLDHRGGRASDHLTGDGAGIMVGLPSSFFQSYGVKQKWNFPDDGDYGVGMLFSPQDSSLHQWTTQLIEDLVNKEGLTFIGWRDVPVNSKVLGPIAAASEPRIRQFFVGRQNLSQKEFNWKLFVVRKLVEEAARHRLGLSQQQVYICSLSSSTIVYKGLLLSHLIAEYYTDLKDPLFQSKFSLVHQRFSTNTLPSWPLAQPFRYIGHNGEINTLRGNINGMRARQRQVICNDRSEDLKKIGSICTPAASDSATLDNTIEFLLHSGRPIHKVLSMVIPEPWEHRQDMSQELRDYYEFQSYIMEPWDGPAFIGFSDGRSIGAVLDRNGLRPGRYWVCDDGYVVMGSEAGLLDIPPEKIIEKGRLSPGKMFLVDLVSGVIKSNEALKSELSNSRPYGSWLEQYRLKFSEQLINGGAEEEQGLDLDDSQLAFLHQAFKYSKEDLRMILAPMAIEAKEPTGSMGNDTPLAVLSHKSPLLFNFFKQLFAQVTNPAIDAIREESVTSLGTFLGAEGNLFKETPQVCRVLRMNQPILSNLDLERIRSLSISDLRVETVSLCFNQNQGLQLSIEKLRREVEGLVRKGVKIIILSDRNLTQGLVAIPSLLAVSAVHHHLIDAGCRSQCSLVVESGEPREVHHFCLLLGYGAAAVNPYLALETIKKKSLHDGYDTAVSVGILHSNYIKAVGQGILKVMSKVGISTLQSYRGAQIFEAIGLSQDFVDEYFTWTPTRIEGIGLKEIEEVLLERYGSIQRGVDFSLPTGGEYAWRRDGEDHLHGPDMIAKMQQATRINSREEFQHFCQTVDLQSRRQLVLRGLWSIKSSHQAIPLEQVEPVSEILKRFSTGAMSFGSISKEAHESIAIAMNKLGAKSNSGEGGEDPSRFTPDANGDLRRSAIKQVASGRFGVTSHYLVNGDELQIKIAQGAKPGEGGQLPGHKVDAVIAKVRHSTPGVTLISPPPHHDIYSIEDLAQLIYDLKNANQQARISVKLVSAAGVGTIAAGVAKAKADVILISGYDGGTGASPLTSIKHAGLPWELGLADAHRTLVENGLRDRVVLQTDGQLRTPRDIAIATILGAEEWSIGSGALVVLGCIMMRKCHLNTCPVGIATQDPELRKKFRGQPQHLMNYFILLAEGIREILADLGLRRVVDLVGRTDFLEVAQDVDHPFASLLNFDKIFQPPQSMMSKVYFTKQQDHGLQDSLDGKILWPKLQTAIQTGKSAQLTVPIVNTNRAVGTMISSQISRRYGATGLPPKLLRLTFNGSAGQSFMAFGSRGILARVEGEVNDYCGKGLSGGDIVVVPPKGAPRDAENQVICGNVALYGGTKGSLFIRGLAGERFGVRNSGVVAVVEGVGDHGCEYMTGGVVVVLGNTGRNFAAGMSGGVAYVYDQTGEFSSRVNLDMVNLGGMVNAKDCRELKALIQRHFNETGSSRAEFILADWDQQLSYFVRVFPQSQAESGTMTNFKQNKQLAAMMSSPTYKGRWEGKWEQGDYHG